jgi:hypothetical protein
VENKILKNFCFNWWVAKKIKTMENTLCNQSQSKFNLNNEKVDNFENQAYTLFLNQKNNIQNSTREVSP